MTVEDGPALIIDADADQLEQVLINLLKNGVEAATGRGAACGFAGAPWTPCS